MYAVSTLLKFVYMQLNGRAAAQRQAESMQSRLKSAASVQNKLQKDLTSADAECAR